MIRINLLGVERQKVRKAAPWLDANSRATISCVVVFGLTAAGIGGWYWSLTREAARLQTEIGVAQAEVARLAVVLAEVRRAEERRAQLQQRVSIIEDLRRGQSVPVQMLDHVSRSIPDLLWLTSLEQKDQAVNLEGRTTTLISLADFVANLGTNRLVAKPIDIVNSQVEGATNAQGVELIKFSVKAPLAQADAPKTAAAGSAVPAAAGTPVAGAAAPAAR
jgi:type IV pilus assembly protein PilN